MASAHDLPLPDHTAPPKAQATSWLAYLQSGAATPEGEAAFKAWLGASLENGRAYARAEQLWRDVGIAAETHREIAPAPKAAARRPWRVAAAASIAAFVFIVVGAGFLRWTAPARPQHLASAVGEVKTATLRDGSRITLGGDSAVDIVLSDKGRNVQLARGGAYFEVAPDKARPFTVRAAATAITVVGTRFDVRKGDDDLRIAVSQGVVKVAPADAAEAVATPPLRLVRGQQVTVSLLGVPGQVRPLDAGAGAWREGRLVYVDERLADVVAELNRYRDVKIELADRSLGELRVSIVLPVDRTDQLLDALEAAEPVRITRSGAGVVIAAAPGAQ